MNKMESTTMVGKQATEAGSGKKLKKDIAASYNKFKEFEGKIYTGAKVGRKQKWYYDKGEWKEQKVTPDKWEFNYAVPKRRAGKAPEGSGAPIGTEYHWYILADQLVKKLDANTYCTSMTGLKYKLNHKRAYKETWSSSELAQQKRLMKILNEMAASLEKKISAQSSNLKKKKSRKTGNGLPGRGGGRRRFENGHRKVKTISKHHEEG